MGTIKKGILGGFSGKVGNVVGGSWKGVSYMRSLPQKVKNPRTEGQLKQRSKFSLVVNYLRPMTALLRTGWKLHVHGQSPFNAATAYALANAVVGTYPNDRVDPNKVLVSRGALTPAVNVAVNMSSGNFFISWDNNSGVGYAKATDKTLIAVINPSRGKAITDIGGAERTTGTQTVVIPDEWKGQEVHAYLGFISENGKDIADSVCIARSIIL